MKKTPQIKKLGKYRNQIDQMDQEILRLFYRRALLVRKIWMWKKKNKLPLFDQKREAQILKKIQAQARPPLRPKSLKKIYQVLLHELHPTRKGAPK